MLTTGEVFNPSDLSEVTQNTKHQSRQKLTVDTAIEYLAAQGYDVSQLAIAAH
jgi:hypothetical protein